MITRFGPLVAVALFWGIGFGWRAWLQQRRYGSSGVMLFRSGDWRQHLREAGLVALALILWVQGVAAAVAPRVLAPLWIAGAPRPEMAWLGLVTVLGAIALLVAAQLHLGASWRVGIDVGARPGLVTEGLYGLSRNPIYLAVFVALAGFALLLPTWPSVLLCFGAPAAFRRQVVYEEAYLRRTYGDEFDCYARRVGRFLPGVGRLA